MGHMGPTTATGGRRRGARSRDHRADLPRVALRALGHRGFRWQGGYGAFTLRKTDLPIVEAYVLRQKEHHAASDVHADWERSTDDAAPRAREGGRPDE